MIILLIDYQSFKPYYKWNTFNTEASGYTEIEVARAVLNLIINGIPSILNTCIQVYLCLTCFKPYYKWNTFNTLKVEE